MSTSQNENTISHSNSQASRAATTAYKAGLCKKAVFELFSELKDGRLDLTLPSGEAHVFGDAASPVRASIHVKNELFFRKCLLEGDIGFGESYVDGDWETDSISNVIAWMLLNVANHPEVSGSGKRMWAINLFQSFNRIIHILTPNSVRGSKKNIAAHYDLSNDFFQLFLDPSLMYSCAYYEKGETDLQNAQWRKCEAMCRKLKLKSTDHVLEIGTGWGGFAMYAAQKYGCHITTVTISEQQYAHAKERIAKAGLTQQVDVRLMDYRDIKGTFDKIVSIEMLEAVGHKYLPVYFDACHRLLKKDGLLALQVIICPDSRYDVLRKSVDWIQRHIFPGSLLPSIAAINQAINKTGDLFLYELEDIGMNYPKTLASWRDRMNANAEKVLSLGFDRTFLRKWNYYFSYCEAAFAMRNISVVQMVYARPNNRQVMA